MIRAAKLANGKISMPLSSSSVLLLSSYLYFFQCFPFPLPHFFSLSRTKGGARWISIRKFPPISIPPIPGFNLRAMQLARETIKSRTFDDFLGNADCVSLLTELFPPFPGICEVHFWSKLALIWSKRFMSLFHPWKLAARCWKRCIDCPPDYRVIRLFISILSIVIVRIDIFSFCEMHIRPLIWYKLKKRIIIIRKIYISKNLQNDTQKYSKYVSLHSCSRKISFRAGLVIINESDA